MDCSTRGFPVLHSLPEFAQTRVHWAGAGEDERLVSLNQLLFSSVSRNQSQVPLWIIHLLFSLFGFLLPPPLKKKWDKASVHSWWNAVTQPSDEPSAGINVGDVVWLNSPVSLFLTMGRDVGAHVQPGERQRWKGRRWPRGQRHQWVAAPSPSQTRQREALLC